MSNRDDIHLDTYPLPHTDHLGDLKATLVTDDCTMVVNDRHDYVIIAHDQDNNELKELPEDDLVKPFMDKSSLRLLEEEEDSMLTRGQNGKILPDGGQFSVVKGSVAVESGEESEGEGEESCTHLLQGKTQEVPSPMGQKVKVHKMPIFRSSPGKKHSAPDTHSHIHHRPLGPPESTVRRGSGFFLFRRKWNAARLACTACVTASLAGLACLLTVGLYGVVPGGGCAPVGRWWQDAVVYEIFPASFQDTDGDGFGDLRGLRDRLDYVQHDLGIDIVRLSSIFSALDYPLEYEHVIDFANVDPHLGRMEDLADLVQAAHERGMRVILDMNPTLTSDQHTWAAHWLLHRPGRYGDFYVNVTDDEEVEPPLEPNYFQRVVAEPPHRTFGSRLFLNWSNPLVQQEMKDVLEMWLSQGVDGFYMKHLEDMRVHDHLHVVEVLRQWRHLMDGFGGANSTTGRKVLMTSQSTLEHLDASLDEDSYWSALTLVDLVDVSLDMVALNGTFGDGLEGVRQFWRRFHPQEAPVPCWHLGSVETPRLASRLEDERSPMGGFLLLATLPGSFAVYYGDELGIQDSVDPFSSKPFRGGQLGLMQWTADANANFTAESTAPWIPVNPDFAVCNVDSRPELTALLKRIADLKRSALLKVDLLTRAPSSTSSSSTATPDFLSDIVSKLSDVYDFGGRGSGFTWTSTSDGMLVVEMATSVDSFVLVLNNGLGSSAVAEAGGVPRQLLPRDVDVLLSTSAILTGRFRLGDIRLHPGEAFVGQFTT